MEELANRGPNIVTLPARPVHGEGAAVPSYCGDIYLQALLAKMC